MTLALIGTPATLRGVEPTVVRMAGDDRVGSVTS
jgi:hypothetical protein